MKVLTRDALRRITGGGSDNGTSGNNQTDSFSYDDNGTHMESK